MSKHSDPTNAINKLYSYGRTYPRGGKPPTPREKDGTFASHSLSDNYEKPDPKQQAVQNPEDRVADHGHVGRNWLCGYGKPHPFFDAGPSGRRYEKK